MDKEELKKLMKKGKIVDLANSKIVSKMAWPKPKPGSKLDAAPPPKKKTEG